MVPWPYMTCCVSRMLLLLYVSTLSLDMDFHVSCGFGMRKGMPYLYWVDKQFKNHSNVCSDVGDGPIACLSFERIAIQESELLLLNGAPRRHFGHLVDSWGVR